MLLQQIQLCWFSNSSAESISSTSIYGLLEHTQMLLMSSESYCKPDNAYAYLP